MSSGTTYRLVRDRAGPAAHGRIRDDDVSLLGGADHDFLTGTQHRTDGCAAA